MNWDYFNQVQKLITGFSTTQKEFDQCFVPWIFALDFISIITEQYLEQDGSCFAFYKLAFHAFLRRIRQVLFSLFYKQ